MKIEKNKWVAIHYTLKDDDGNTIDSSIGGAPLGYLHGNGYLIFGLENELEGKEQGDKFSCKIKPIDGYGEYDPQLILDVDRKQFETDQEIEVGMQFQVMTPQGPSIVTVKEVGPETIKIDGNHELAGKNLNFDVEVVEVREPTEEELNPQGCGGGCGGCCGEEGGCGCDGDCGSGCGGCH